jgi:hypothetical protein
VVRHTIAPRVKTLPPLVDGAGECPTLQGIGQGEVVGAHICRILDLLCPVVAHRFAEMYKGFARLQAVLVHKAV